MAKNKKDNEVLKAGQENDANLKDGILPDSGETPTLKDEVLQAELETLRDKASNAVLQDENISDEEKAKVFSPEDGLRLEALQNQLMQEIEDQAKADQQKIDDDTAKADQDKIDGEDGDVQAEKDKAMQKLLDEEEEKKKSDELTVLVSVSEMEKIKKRDGIQMSAIRFLASKALSQQEFGDFQTTFPELF